MSKISTFKRKSVLTQTMTLTDILKKNNSPKLIDLFSLDVEGYEFDVLEGIDFNNYKFSNHDFLFASNE
jgi:FkbM family methyltransferase